MRHQVEEAPVYQAIVKTADGRAVNLGFENAQGLAAIRQIPGSRAYLLVDDEVERRFAEAERADAARGTTAEPPPAT